MRFLLASPLLVALSIGYGVVVALVAVLAPAALPPVAIIGALVVGGLWAVKGALEGRQRTR